jgi:hypothetical protein
MKTIGRLTGLTLILILAAAVQGHAASASASAKATSRSSGTPSTYAVKQHFIAMEQARIRGQIREAERCIANASNTQVVRDPEGNLNRVPQVDLIDCARSLQQLTRQLATLARKADQLTRDAEVAAIRLEGIAEEALRQERTQPSGSQSSGGM